MSGGMGLGLRLLIVIDVIAVVVVSLFIANSVFMRFVPGPPPPAPIVFDAIYYGYLHCGSNIVIPGNSMVILYYHPHGNVTVNEVAVFVSFPVGIINETMSAFSRLANKSGAMLMGVYVDGRLIAVSNTSSPVMVLNTIVNQRYFYGNKTVSFWQAVKISREVLGLVEFIGYYVGFPAVNLTSGDTVAVIIYSAVPYALPSCRITSEAEEAKLMVRDHLIGLGGPLAIYVEHVINVTPTAEQLYEEGRYITEEPVIYIINVTKPIQGLPQELPTGAEPFVVGYAPSYEVEQTLPSPIIP